ncbi:MAG: hypothetical protein IKX57_07640 [Oscillospiraceae bacterium]|nr:hypothetical protein [Oscillospiraceae bacterium]
MERWVCSRCNSKNQGNMKFCPVCHLPRPAVPALPQDDQAMHKHPHRPHALLWTHGSAVMKLMLLFHLAALSASLVGTWILRGR